MRGEERRQRPMLMVPNVEQRIAKDHPLRRIKQMADLVLKDLSPVLDQMYSAVGRPSIPPERLLKASLLMALYTVRSERMFCEQLDYNLLFRWFLDLEMDELSFDHSTFSRNRARLLAHEVAGEFFRGVAGAEAAFERALHRGRHPDRGLGLAQELPAQGPRSGRAAGRSRVNFHGERRSNHPSVDHRSRGQAGAQGCGQGSTALLLGQRADGERNSILIDFQIEPADGHAERRAAIAMTDERLPGPQRITLGGDKGYDTRDFVASCRALKITPHVARNQTRAGGSALDARTARHPGYAISQRIRKRVEEAFGWMKSIGGLRRTRYRGRDRVQMHGYIVAAAYNLIRIAHLMPAPA